MTPRSRAPGLRLLATCARTASATRRTTRSRCSFTVDDGPKVYIERIDIVGNTRTRDYVIRREFDIGEGDPYNHAMIERGERRLNNLGFFKKVHISNRPGSSPDRVIVTVEVEDQPTGSFSLSGGYSTTKGFIAEARLHRDQLPRPRPVCAPQRLGRPVQPGLEGVVHRALFPRPAPRGRLRHLPQGQLQQPVRALRELDDRRARCASAFRSPTS